MATLYHIALVTHIIGLSMAAGTTPVAYLFNKGFWKHYRSDKPTGMAMYNSMPRFSILFGSGFILLIISGVIMMALTHGVFGEQMWFQIKFGLLIIIIINGIAIGRRQGLKLKRLLAAEKGGNNVEVSMSKTRSTLNMLYAFQMILFIIVFALSVFKFN
jgi:hypothetical protein